MESTWVVNLPLTVDAGGKAPFPLNLNTYRNANWTRLDKAKNNFKEVVSPLLVHIPALQQIRISYYLFTRNKSKLDIANVCSIVDKFFCDVLVEAGKIPDDNYNHLIGVAFCHGGVDKDNPRVEALIELVS